jgi:hypothetical protein
MCGRLLDLQPQLGRGLFLTVLRAMRIQIGRRVRPRRRDWRFEMCLTTVALPAIIVLDGLLLLILTLDTLRWLGVFPLR